MNKTINKAIIPKNDVKDLLTIFKNIKHNYNSSDDVEETKNFMTIGEFCKKVIYSNRFQNDNNLYNIINICDNLLTGWQVLHLLHCKMNAQFEYAHADGLLNADTFVQYAKELQKLEEESGGSIKELKTTHFINTFHGFRKATYHDLVVIMNKITDEIK